MIFFVICTTGARESCDMSAKTWWMAEKRTCSKRPTSPGCWSARSIEYKWGNPVEKFNWKKLYYEWHDEFFNFPFFRCVAWQLTARFRVRFLLQCFGARAKYSVLFRGSMNISRLVPSSESRVIIIENKWEISSSSAWSSAQQFNVKFRVSSRVIFLSSIIYFISSSTIAVRRLHAS